jgi:hypothetical protein
MKKLMERVCTYLIKGDVKLVITVDGWTTYIQRKGWAPLNTIKMLGDCLFWGSLSYSSMDGFLVYFIVPVGGLAMWASHRKWSEDTGYWENARKTQKLNAEVWAVRLNAINWRILVYATMGPIAIMDIITFDYSRIVSSFGVVLVNYLTCCLYLGPGDYAKDKKESLASLPQES